MPSEPPPLDGALLTVSTAAATQLDPVWKLGPAEITTALFDVLPDVVATWGLAAAALAADWYDDLRASHEIKGKFTAMVKPLDLGADALAAWAAEALAAELVDEAQFRVEGGLQKRIVNAANFTITDSADKDPQARGYMRRTNAGACRFCVMVASRPAVYVKASATFACHENCFCEAVPAWGGKALPVRRYKPSDRPSTPEDRARVRKWIADNL